MKRLISWALAALLLCAPLTAFSTSGTTTNEGTNAATGQSAYISEQLNRYLSPTGDRYGKPLPEELLKMMGIQDTAAQKDGKGTDWSFWMLLLQECKKDPTPTGLRFKEYVTTNSILIPEFRDTILSFLNQPENAAIYGGANGANVLFTYLNIQHALGYGFEELMRHLMQHYDQQ